MTQYLEQRSVCGNPKVKESKWQSRWLTLLCAGLCESLVTLQRLHFAASNNLHEHPRGHSSWRESTRMKFMKIQMGYSKMRSEPSDYMWKTRVILIHLENNFGKYAQEVWERNWMNPDMHTVLLDTKLLNATLFNMYNTISMETILKALREQSKEDDQMKSAWEITGSVPETFLVWDSILRERGGFGNDNQRNIH